MKLNLTLPIIAVFALLGSPNAGAEPKVKLKQIYSGLETERPLALVVPPDGTNRRFLVEQTGKIRILPADESATGAKLFADFADTMEVEKNFEEGLLGLAFHPEFKENGKLYVHYTAQGPKRSVISEFIAKGDSLDMNSERILMEVQQPEWNHNSGNLLFGPKDGMLYIAFGDGGFRDGIHLLAQRLQAWNGKVLRIDVNSKSEGREYGIPSDNPFVDVPAACPEIWALGLRNPWGMSIDPETGDFWLADVGQDLWEEVNLIEKGGNYGWNYQEGARDFATRTELMGLLKRKNNPPRGVQFIPPVHEYSRADGLSITGGFVYRGDKVPSLKGHYIFGDWKFGNMWALDYDSVAGEVKGNHQIEKPADPAKPNVQPTGIYPDENGEVIVLGWNGRIFRIVST
ncbi:MAG: glucose sorbosone dehydrogenase [Verrucomicrobiales bacterium]|nr:glucose sorbosone dehydrogenase [Verrucomicrobiales bacterium]